MTTAEYIGFGSLGVAVTMALITLLKNRDSGIANRAKLEAKVNELQHKADDIQHTLNNYIDECDADRKELRAEIKADLQRIYDKLDKILSK